MSLPVLNGSGQWSVASGQQELWVGAGAIAAVKGVSARAVRKRLDALLAPSNGTRQLYRRIAAGGRGNPQGQWQFNVAAIAADFPQAITAGELAQLSQVRGARCQVADEPPATRDPEPETSISVGVDSLKIVPAAPQRAFLFTESRALPPHLARQADECYAVIAPLVEFLRQPKKQRGFTPANHAPIRTSNDLVKWLARQPFPFTDEESGKVVRRRVPAGTIWRWYSAWKKRGKDALADQARSDRGVSKLFGRAPQSIPDEGLEKLLDSLTAAGRYVAGLALRDNFSPRACYDELQNEHASVGLAKPPSYGAVLRFLNSFPPAVRDFVRLNGQQWDNRHRPYHERDYLTARVMEWWNLDHAQDDFFVYNDFLPELDRYVFPDYEQNAWLRMWLTAVEDVRSRYLVGYAFSAIPSSNSIVSAIRMAVLRTGRPCRYGLVDRGKDFLKTAVERPRLSEEHAGAFRRLVRAFYGKDGEIVKAIGRNPQSKPIESRFSLKRNRFDSRVHSRCGNAPHHRPDSTQPLLDAHDRWRKDGASGISPSLPRASEAIRGTVQWIEGWYHRQHRHSGHGMGRRTAEEVFRAGWPFDQQGSAREKLDPRALEEFLWHRTPRSVRNGGCVRLFNSQWEPADAESLGALRAWDGDERQPLIACDPHQPDYAVAFHPETGERLGALVAKRRFAWGEPQENIKAHLRQRGNFKRAVKGFLEQLPQRTTAAAPFAFLGGDFAKPALVQATGTDGQSPDAPITQSPDLVASSPRVLRARAEAAAPKIKSFACDVSDRAADLLDQVEVEE
jgi:transposase InsO family protein